MTMPLYVSMHNNANMSNADVNATGFKNPYETYLTEQQAHLNTLLNLANEEKNQAPYNQYIQYMSALTKDPNNSNIWKDATGFLNRYAHNPQGFMQEYPKTLTGMNLYKPGNFNDGDTGKLPPKDNDTNKNKPGFFGNIWDRITEQPGAFTESVLNIWNSIRANDLAKDYSNLMRDSFNLQKQQYLDREDRAKKEFAALQSRRAGSSL